MTPLPLLVAVLLTAQLIHGQQQQQQVNFTSTSTSQQPFPYTTSFSQFPQTSDQQQFQTGNTPLNQVTINPGPAEIAQADVNGIVAETYNLRVQLPVGDNSSSGIPLFIGSLIMEIRVVREMTTVILNARELNISANSVSMNDQSGAAITISNMISAPETEAIALETAQPLTPGQLYTITFQRFTGRVNVGGAEGVFASYVQDTPGGDQLYAMATQFQTNAARLVFPCLDTPKTKATLALTIVHPSGTIPTGNMEVQQTRSLDANWNEATFAITPQIPTYLMAFAVLPDVYEVVERVWPINDIVVRMRYNPREIYDAEQLLEYAIFSLDTLSAKFSDQLPIRKLDLIILPNFNGGMENFAMITLSQETLTTQAELFKLHLIAHEIAHQWIGNLATIGTWTELCLQEDLTDLYAYKVVDAWTRSTTAQPQGQINNTQWSQFELYNYMEVQTVENLFAPGESLILFADPTPEAVGTRCYLKGVVLYKALERLIGMETFEGKIRDFLAQFKYRSYRMSDFLTYFGDQYVDGKTSVAQVFDFWYKNGGFPELLAQRDYDRNEIKLTQANMGKVVQMGKATWREMPLWPFPITVSTRLGDEPSPVKVMVTAGLSIGPLPVDRQQYFLINSDFAGFYRVNYDRANWNLIQRAMQDNPDQFTPLTRAQLINDFCYFNAQGQVQSGEPLRQAFVKMVYDQPSKYDLCHWYMNYCSASPAVLAVEPKDDTKTFVTDLMKHFNDLFTNYGNRTDFSCQTQAVQIGNRICQVFFGGQCYPTF